MSIDVQKNAQHESCELSFIWGKMRPAAPGDSTSESSERLPQSPGPSQFMWDFGEEVLCLVAQSCPTLCDPMDCNLPGSSVHGLLQARILE